MAWSYLRPVVMLPVRCWSAYDAAVDRLCTEHPRRVANFYFAGCRGVVAVIAAAAAAGPFPASAGQPAVRSGVEVMEYRRVPIEAYDDVPEGVIAAVDADECPPGWDWILSRDGEPLFIGMSTFPAADGSTRDSSGAMHFETFGFPARVKRGAAGADSVRD